MTYVFLADGFEEIEAITPIDILRRAGAEVKTAGVGKREITGRSNITVTADIEVSEIKLDSELRMIILPGGMPGVDNLYASDKVREAVSYAAENDVFIAAICAAPSIPGKMNLLKGKRAVCYPGFEKFLEGAEISSDSVVTDGADGKYITAKGAGVSLEFALKLVEILCGEAEAEKIRKAIIC
jgi:4-methyl-5(b-hydroxyethyl)-thiazole monophosphate biosynthesis